MRLRSAPAADAKWEPRSGRARVLVEDEDGASQWVVAGLLTKAGYDVAVCGGPARLPKGRCALIRDGHCPLAAGADVILNSLPLTPDANRALLASLRANQSSTPVIIETTQLRARNFQEELEGCRLLLEPVDGQQLLAEVDAALAAPDGADARVEPWA